MLALLLTLTISNAYVCLIQFTHPQQWTLYLANVGLFVKLFLEVRSQRHYTK